MKGDTRYCKGGSGKNGGGWDSGIEGVIMLVCFDRQG